MFARVTTVAFEGIEARAVDVQVQIGPGLPAFTIVGLADKAVAESRERVRGALNAIGLALPPKRITVNLAPADLPKEGSHYDLPIALGLMAAIGRDCPRRDRGLSACSANCRSTARSRRWPACCPRRSAPTRSASGPDLPGGVRARKPPGPAPTWTILAPPDLIRWSTTSRARQMLSPAGADAGSGATRRTARPASDIKGQETAKRALEIAAAGGHNLLMIGPPGAGKSMLARRLPVDLAAAGRRREVLEVSHDRSRWPANWPADASARARPFRAPHHSARRWRRWSAAALQARPGEAALAHLGVLFLDELPEFQPQVLEALRQPLETGETVIARANAHVSYPARVQLIAAMNPCRCGRAGEPGYACRRARALRRRLPGAHLGPAARPHRPA